MSIKHPVSFLFYHISQAITFIDTTFSQFVYINYCVNELGREGSRLWGEKKLNYGFQIVNFETLNSPQRRKERKETLMKINSSK